MLAILAGLFVSKVLGGRIGPRSFYQRSWDWLWDQFGTDPRFILVTTEAELLYGQLAFADDPAKGADIVLVDPSRWDDEKGDFFRSGMKYLLVPGSEIKRVELSIADPPKPSDYPYYEAGYVADSTPGQRREDHGKGKQAVQTSQEGSQ
jgi:hypothetical protein